MEMDGEIAYLYVYNTCINLLQQKTSGSPEIVTRLQ